MRWLGNIAVVSLLLASCSSGNLVEECENNLEESRGLIEINTNNILEFYAELASNKRSFTPSYNKGKDIKRRYDKTNFDGLLTHAELIKIYEQHFEEITSYIPDRFKERLSLKTYDTSINTLLLKELIKSDLAVLTKDCISFIVASISYCGPRDFWYSPWNISYEVTTDTMIVFNDYLYMAYKTTALVLSKGSEWIKDYATFSKENAMREDTTGLRMDYKIIGFPYNEKHSVTLKLKSTRDTGYEEWSINPNSLFFKK